jgi:hypothetical protein
MSVNLSTDDVLNEAQEYVSFKFFSFKCSVKNLPFVGEENLIYLVKFRDLDAKHAFLEHFKRNEISLEQWEFLKQEQVKNIKLLLHFFAEKEMTPSESYPIYGLDAREFFSVKNLKNLTSVETVQRKLETTKHAKVIGVLNRDDEAL